MAPAEKSKFSTKQLTEVTNASPISSIRTRSTTAPPSLAEIMAGMQSVLNPKIDNLSAEFRTLSTSMDNRMLDLENVIDIFKADATAANQNLQDQLTLVLKRLENVEKENEALRNTVNKPALNSEFPALGTSASKHAPPPASDNDPIPTQPSHPRGKGNLRLFTPVSDNQGFQFLYLPLRGRKPLKEIRAELRKVHINSGSVLDICYPAPRVVALLVHNDFAPKALELLKAENVLPMKDFDPLDPKNLMNPEFKDATPRN